MPRVAADRPSRVRTVFLGSGAFAAPILVALVAQPDLEIVGVVTPPDRRAGRSAKVTAVPVAATARSHGLPLLQVERVRLHEAVEAFRSLAPELGILADFGQLIPQAILDIPRLGIVNIHPSLLPRHRGATPIPATILAGDRVAGVSIMRMDAGLDTGPVVATRSWDLDGTEDAPTLEARATKEAVALLEQVLPEVLSGRHGGTPQDAAAATMTRPLGRESGRLDPRRPAAQLERQVRAMRPWPGTFVEVAGIRLGVHDVEVADGRSGDTVGALVADGSGLALSTATGRLVLRTVQPAGGRPMTGAAFRRGRPMVIGAHVTPGIATIPQSETPA